MARSGAGSHYLHTTSSIADPVLGGTNSPFNANGYSFHCFVKSSVAPNQGSIRSAMNFIGDNTGSANNPYDNLLWDHTSASFTKAAAHRNASPGGGFNSAQVTSSLSTGTWYSFGQTFDSFSLRVWLNGVNEALTSSLSPADNKKVFLGILGAILSDGSTEGQFSNGEVAEVAFWQTVLGTTDFQALSQGFRAHRVRMNTLISYLPLVRVTQDIKGGYAWTEVNSPTTTDHPRVFG